MTGVIVDASVAIKWFVSEEQAELAEAILNCGLRIHAPGLLELEAANGLWKKSRKSAFPLADVVPSVLRLKQLVDQWHGDAGLIEAAAALSLELDHPVYDCVYLALSRHLGAPVITTDRRLLLVAPKGDAIALQDWRP